MDKAVIRYPEVYKDVKIESRYEEFIDVDLDPYNTSFRKYRYRGIKARQKHYFYPVNQTKRHELNPNNEHDNGEETVEVIWTDEGYICVIGQSILDESRGIIRIRFTIFDYQNWGNFAPLSHNSTVKSQGLF